MKSWPLEVWAPQADKVEAVVAEERITMHQNPDKPGWWLSETHYLAGTRYGFILDDEGPFPDPRSPRQPYGIDWLSCLVDHTEFAWTDDRWSPPPPEQAVIYELHVGTFSEEGTFEGAIQHLDHLVRLGITHIELLPVAGFPGERNWGYDCVSIYAPNEVYGGPDGLKSLIDACHANGLGVIVDVIYNHMGAEGNYAPRFGPYFTSKYSTPWGEGPNLDGDQSEEARAFFIDNALMWLRDYHADGLRFDAIDKVTDNSEIHFLVELREAVDRLVEETGRTRLLIAESAANDPIYVKPVDEGGYGTNAQWADDIHHAMHSFFTGERDNYYADFGELDHLAKAYRQGFVYDGCFSVYRGEPHGKSPDGLPPSSFLACLQNHDQTGNRPHGERFHHLPEVGHLEQKIASALLLLSPFTPMIFMGEEWAASTPFEFFSDHQDPEIAAAVGAGRKEEFGGGMWNVETIPDPQDEGCFLRSKLKWDERFEEEHRGMLGWYSQLLNLRKENGPLTEHARVKTDPHGRWLRMTVGRFDVLAALTKGNIVVPSTIGSDYSLQLSAGVVHTLDDGSLEFNGRGVAVIRKDR